MKTILFVAGLSMLGGNLFFAAADCGTCAASKDAVVALVEKAAALVAQNGDKAFADFRKKDSEWFKGEVYIFADDLEGNNLCHPASPDLEGQNLLGMKDANGKEFVREMIALVESKGAGWVEYSFRKPGADAASKKLAYVKKTTCGGKAILVGSGIYAD